MKAEVEKAIEQIRASFPGKQLTAREDGEGGAYVIVDDVELGPPYSQDVTWVGARITFQYPYADVYRHRQLAGDALDRRMAISDGPRGVG